MSGAVPAEEIADDFRHGLEFLQSPDRYAINNFTVIAKENTEHADAISNVLVDHIRKAPPHHKLPALYVLDSIAKNIGTPYSLFLGHKLYGVFMGAYSSVDTSTRRKLDEMLKTWKSPVPGSIDPTPVFPPEITKKIENALIQARTAALKHDHSQIQIVNQKRPASALAATQWRGTPTPPSQAAQYAPPAPQTFPHQPGLQAPFAQQALIHPGPQSFHYQYRQTPSGVMLPTGFGAALHSTVGYDQPAPFSSSHIPTMQASTYQNLAVDMNALHRDIDILIQSCRLESQNNQTDSRIMSKLQALIALKDVLNTQSLPTDQLLVVRRQVDDLQAAERRETAERQTFTASSTFPSMAQQLQTGYSSNAFALQRATGSQAETSSKQIGPTDLASLLAKASGGMANSSSPAVTLTAPLSERPDTGQTNSGSFSTMLANLANKGLFGPGGQHDRFSIQTAAKTSSTGQSVADLIARASGLASPAESSIQLNSASLKILRPYLFKGMLERLPNQCVNCGLRFPSSEDGRRKKDQHMDWHFRANQRISDSSRGIQSRSWFVGELEWIKSRDGEEQLDSSTAEQGAVNGSNPMASAPKYVPVPGDPDAHQPCPICQEPFDTGFNQDIQDWVWLDAVRVGGKIFHASCFADLRRDGLESREKTCTPDSVLGKRKAESSNDVTPAKKAVMSG